MFMFFCNTCLLLSGRCRPELYVEGNIAAFPFCKLKIVITQNPHHGL